MNSTTVGRSLHELGYWNKMGRQLIVNEAIDADTAAFPAEVLGIALGLRGAVTESGFDYPVGIAGSRLSSVQRRKLAIARGAEASGPARRRSRDRTLDAASQTRILDNLLKEFDSRALICVVHRASLAERFARTIVLEGGKVVERGTYPELNRSGTVLHELVLAG